MKYIKVIATFILFVVYNIYSKINPLIGNHLSTGQLESSSYGYLIWETYKTANVYIPVFIALIFVLVWWKELKSNLLKFIKYINTNL